MLGEKPREKESRRNNSPRAEKGLCNYQFNVLDTSHSAVLTYLRNSEKLSLN